jgi:hypothetical protein
MKKLLSANLPHFRKYFSEKNALTVVASLFCLAMLIVSIGREAIWESIAFGLAFSFSVELICHRTREKK